MATRLTVFYSWQSDTPSNLNRSFIEKALLEALKRLHSDATLEEALRDATVDLDKDTLGVAGSPPIAETILSKIEGCAVFVADLSFVGESKPGLSSASGKARQFPNPNVLMEYGYALRCHSHTKLVGIMNTAYGEPSAESLPFDLRHLRWPRCYHLAEPTAADKKDQFEGLVTTITRDIGLILSNSAGAKDVAEGFTPQRATKSPALFFDSPADLVGDRSDKFTVPDGGKAYLRLYPSFVVPPLSLELEARELATKGNLQPLGRVSGWGFDRNIFGAIAYAPPENGKLYHFTQLFLNREIWGVDAEVLNEDYLDERMKEWGRANFPSRHIASGYIEEYFIRATLNYLGFAKTQLKLEHPLGIEAGLVGIKGYSIAVRDNHVIGNALRDAISWKATVETYAKPAVEILGPFFDLIWANCGIPRTSQDQDALVKRFGGIV